MFEYPDIVFNYKYYILDVVIENNSVRYSFHDKEKLDEYIRFLHGRMAELKTTLNYSIKEETSADRGH